MSYEYYKVDVPEGKSGNWRIERFTIDKQKADFEHLRGLVNGHGRGVPEGTYTGLYRGNAIIMSDTPDEIRDHLPFILRATGRVLIAGLGLGMVAQAVANKPEVTDVTVVEQSVDVITLVGAHYMNRFPNKLSIVCNDIFEWETASKFDCAWFDIWDDLCTDNLDEMAKLHRKFGRKAAYKDSWGKALLKRKRDQEKRNPWRW